MFGPVKRCYFRPLVYVLVAAQLLLSAPVVSAAAAGSSSIAEMPCADSMPTAEKFDHCPCCPDGVTTMAGCMSACAVTATALGTTIAHVHRSPVVPIATTVFNNLAESADPPLKPPPIA